MNAIKYKRVLLKLSGEAFSGETDYGIDTPTLIRIAKQLRQVMTMGGDIAIVVGGGNECVHIKQPRSCENGCIRPVSVQDFCVLEAVG